MQHVIYKVWLRQAHLSAFPQTPQAERRTRELLLHAQSRIWEQLDSIPLITGSISRCERTIVNGKDGSLSRAAVSSQQQISEAQLLWHKSACVWVWEENTSDECERVLLVCDSRHMWVLKSSVPVIHSQWGHWRRWCCPPILSPCDNIFWFHRSNRDIIWKVRR